MWGDAMLEERIHRAGRGNWISADAIRPRGSSCAVTITDGYGLAQSERERLRELAQRAAEEALRGFVGGCGEVRVRVVGDEEMAPAHARYSGVEGTTDVLTFDLAEGGSTKGGSMAGVLDVDILVCADEAGRQAAAHGHERWRELLLYVLHGVLHCVGHDDQTDEGFALMHAEEDRILREIGVGATFARSKGGGAADAGAG